MNRYYKVVEGFGALLLVVLLVGCSGSETHRTVASEKVEGYRTAYSGTRTTLAVGSFDNRSSYMQGLFSTDTDRLGGQAKTILTTHLQSSNRFNVVDRENIEQLQKEAGLRGEQQRVLGARYVVTGSVSEFGRKVTGDRQLFGILGSGKSQIAYSKVSLNIVDVVTSQVVYSTQGAGEYQLDNREVLGFGSTASYDATLNGKVLNFAITEAVNNMVRDLENGAWKPVE
jgi:curli biogenesis system outer membrane secretion channel CsgG